MSPKAHPAPPLEVLTLRERDGVPVVTVRSHGIELYSQGGTFHQIRSAIQRAAPDDMRFFIGRLTELVMRQARAGSGKVAIEALGARVEVWVEVVG